MKHRIFGCEANRSSPFVRFRGMLLTDLTIIPASKMPVNGYIFCYRVAAVGISQLTESDEPSAEMHRVQIGWAEPIDQAGQCIPAMAPRQARRKII